MNGSPNNTNAVVGAALQVGGWGTDSSYRFSGRIDEVSVFNGALTQPQVTSLYDEPHPCGVGIPAISRTGVVALTAALLLAAIALLRRRV